MNAAAHLSTLLITVAATMIEFRKCYNNCSTQTLLFVNKSSQSRSHRPRSRDRRPTFCAHFIRKL